MYRDHTVGVVIPAHDEESFVGDVIETVPAFVDRVYAIDDASTDGTWDVLRARCGNDDAKEPSESTGRDDQVTDARTVPDGGEASLEHRSDERSVDTPGTVVCDRVTTVREGERGRQRLVALRHADNRGVGGAIKTGYRQAHADGVDVVAVMDGDGQMNPDLLDRLLDPIVDGEAEYAKGNRLFTQDDRAAMSGWRLLGNSLLTGLTKVASGYWKMVDPQNGYNAISWRALDTVTLDDLYDGYGFRNDLLVAMNAYGLPIADVEMPALYGEEQSGIRYRQFVPRLSYLLLRGFLRRLKVKYVVRDFHPLVGLYGLGALGFLVWAVDAVRALLRGDRSASGWLTSTVLLVASGTALVLAMVFDMLANESLHTVVDDDE